MIPLSEHPEYIAQQERYALLGPGKPYTKIEISQLAVHIKHLLTLDPTAVYKIVGDSTVVYYDSGYKPKPPGHVARIILAPDGSHRRIDTVGFDPRQRTAA